MDKPRAVLLFELGRLQVFWYPTEDDIKFEVPPKMVYWQDKESRNTYGPFVSVHSAMTHYTWLASLEKVSTAVVPETDLNIIKIDFVKKSRIV